MAWPIGDLISIVREVAREAGGIRGAANLLNIGIGTVQDILANPTRPRRLGTLLNIQLSYESLRPEPEPGPMGTTRYRADTWLPSQLDDLVPPRGSTGYHIIYDAQPDSETPSGIASTGWTSFDFGSPATFIRGAGIPVGALREIRFGRASSP